MGVIIAVIIWPNGAEFVVIPERYPPRGAQSSRLTVAAARNPARLEDGDGWRAGSRGIPLGSGGGRGVRRARATRKYDQPLAQTPAQLVNRVQVQSASHR
jgi:hypothetical protein